jgi:hypothetical protein
MDLMQIVRTPAEACEIVQDAYRRQLKDAPRMHRRTARPARD